MKVAIILFPGTNCEDEAKRAVEAAGMMAEIVRWNADPSKLRDYSGYVLPGGWSYEDRIRAGVIASKDRVTSIIKEEAAKGKPVLGICNGAQVLLETGIVPGTGEGMALAPNINPVVSGFYCRQVQLRVNKKRDCAFSKYLNDADVLPIHVAHGEGRFVSQQDDLADQLVENGQVLFQYCTEDGRVVDEYPVNPNGSVKAIAGVINEKGNALAIMPHPERSCFTYQLPPSEKKRSARTLEDMYSSAPCRKIFESMRDHMRDMDG